MPDPVNKPSRKQTENNSTEDAFALFGDYFKRTQKLSFSGLSEYWNVKTAARGSYLFRKGEQMRELSFIVSGAVKLITPHNNTPVILSLLTENNFCTIVSECKDGIQYEYDALCAEDTVCLTISCSNMGKLLASHPEFYRFLLCQNESLVGNMQKILFYTQALPAMERYLEFSRQYPELMHRFSLRDIASYLGMKAETLSRARNQSLKNAGKDI